MLILDAITVGSMFLSGYFVMEFPYRSIALIIAAGVAIGVKNALVRR